MIESILALGVVTMFLLLPILAISEYQATLSAVGFCRKLETAILTAQQNAIVSGQSSRVFYSEGDEATVYFNTTVGEKMTLSEINVPNELVVKSFPEIRFNKGSGNYSSMGTVVIDWPRKEKTIRYRFLFGSGRYEKIIE